MVYVFSGTGFLLTNDPVRAARAGELKIVRRISGEVFDVLDLINEANQEVLPAGSGFVHKQA